MTGLASPAPAAAADAVERGKRVLRMEREAIAEAEERLGESFARAVAMIAASRGRVIVTGVGKSGLIGRKIAATLTSTGTPASSLSPLDAVHGDLGIVDANDVALLLSKSGESDELLSLLEHLKRLGVKTVAFTGNPRSTLGRNADVVLDCSVREEACPHDLAPTTSTTVALAIGDALAVALLEAKGFRREDFARIHPGGALGRRLLTTVGDVMIADELPLLPPQATMRAAVVQLAKRRGVVIVVEPGDRLAGVLTTGDLTRLMERTDDVFHVPVSSVMTRSPRYARVEELATAVVYRMEQHKIMAMPVLDRTERVVGVVHLHDLMRAGAA
jgi:arabinose-5-phosphate isomerase